MREMKSFLWEVVTPFAGMASVEFTDVVMATLGKAAMSKGMSPFVYVFYFSALGTFLLLPPYLFYRHAKVSATYFWISQCIYFLLGLFGIGFSQTLWFIAIRYSSPTLSSVMSSSIPAFTFILAIIFRMEKLDLRLQTSQVKSVGAIVSFTGAFIVTLYKGTPIILIPSSPPLDAHDHHYPLLLLSAVQQSNWILGGLLLGCCCFLATNLYIFQAATVKKYPSEITLVFFFCFFGTIQCGIITYFAEPDPNAWKIKSDLELITIIFAAVFASVYRTGVQTWGLHIKGPVYATMFKPLGIIFAVVLGVTFLGDILYIGSVVGSVVIAVGFYGVMWGKAQEEKNMAEENGVLGNLQVSSTHGQKVPLLQRMQQ